MSEYLVYAILFAIVLGYALLLNTQQGKNFANEYTWASVVIGTVLVLGAAYLLIPTEYWIKLIISFVVAGAPMIGRSLINKSLMKTH